MTRTLKLVLITLGDPGKLTGGYLYHRRLAALAPGHNARIAFMSFPERPFPLAVFDAPGVLRRSMRLQPDALVIDSIAAAFLGPYLVIKRPPVPLIGMLHQPPGGIDNDYLRTTLQWYLDKLAYRRARLLLVASDLLREELTAQGVPGNLLRVVPPGRDVASTAGPPASFTDLRMGRRAAILCVGNWVERKGILSLLEAFALLPEDAATLHLVGDNQADPKYSARVNDRLSRPGLAGRVVVHGPLPLSEVAALYESADLFALPSIKEPYGTVYGEAMSAGLPVVGWRAGNLPYLAQNGREGLLVEPGDIADLSAALHRLAEDGNLRRAMGQAARVRALARPTWDESAALFFSAIKEVVGSSIP